MANDNGSCDLSIVALPQLQMQSADDTRSHDQYSSLLYSCQKYEPRRNSPSCNVCGCLRALHPNGARRRARSTRVPKLLPLLENLERGNDVWSLVVVVPNNNPPVVTIHRPMRQSRLPRQPRAVTRKVRTKVTREQEDLMEMLTNEIIGWDPRKHNRNLADCLCNEMGISRTYYLQWIRDMKLLRDSEREAARMQAEREAQVAEAARSLLSLCNS